MKLYLTTGSTGGPVEFTGTQDDAKASARRVGGKWAPEEVPDAKADRIAWLNKFITHIALHLIPGASQPTPVVIGPVPVITTPDPEDGALVDTSAGVPMVALKVLAQSDPALLADPRPNAQRGKLKLQAGRELDQICDLIEAADSFVLARITETVITRMTTLKRQAGLEGGQ
jgi:hypothetical protein